MFKYINIYLSIVTQKTISLSEKAYTLLKNSKMEGESFSDLIERIISKNKNPWLSMRGKFDPELFDRLEENLVHLREDNLSGDRDSHQNY